MIVAFVKMSGAGNDAVMIDHREEFLRGKESAFAIAACDRRFGVGADTLILLEDDPETDFFVRFFNPDGGEYELCGNGARCVPHFAVELGWSGPEFRFRTLSGVHEARVLGPQEARLDMARVAAIRTDIPVSGVAGISAMDWGEIGGVPHAAIWVEDADSVAVEVLGARLSRHPEFTPSGTNVSFVQRVGEALFRIRTFERGIEGETLACGSGSTVVAAIAQSRGWIGTEARFSVRSGDMLVVGLPEDPDGRPTLRGPVWRAFAGTLDLELFLSRGSSRSGKGLK